MPVEPTAHHLAIPHLANHRPRHYRPSPGRRDGLSRDGGQPFCVDAARRPLHEDTILRGEDVEHLEADVGEGRNEALVGGGTRGARIGVVCDTVAAFTVRVVSRVGRSGDAPATNTSDLGVEGIAERDLSPRKSTMLFPIHPTSESVCMKIGEGVGGFF